MVGHARATPQQADHEPRAAAPPVQVGVCVVVGPARAHQGECPWYIAGVTGPARAQGCAPWSNLPGPARATGGCILVAWRARAHTPARIGVCCVVGWRPGDRRRHKKRGEAEASPVA